MNLTVSCSLRVGFSVNPSGARAAALHTCIPSACRRIIELGDSTTCCFLCSTLGNKSLQMNTAAWFQLSLEVGGWAMEAPLVAVNLWSVWGHSLAVSCGVICLAAPLNQPGKYFYRLDLVLSAWGLKAIHLLLFPPDCNRKICTGLILNLGTIYWEFVEL